MCHKGGCSYQVQLYLHISLMFSFYIHGCHGYCRFVSGVIPSDKMESFMRMLWFACRGNVFVRNAEVPELILDAHTVSVLQCGAKNQ